MYAFKLNIINYTQGIRHLATTMRTIHVPRIWDKLFVVCTHMLMVKAEPSSRSRVHSLFVLSLFLLLILMDVLKVKA